MAYSPTTTFSAGTKAVAAEVNQNFSDINSAGFADTAVSNTFSGKTNLSVTTDADLNIALGAVPTTNLANGDMYIDSGTNRLTIRTSGSFDRYALFSEISAGDITEVVAGAGLTGGATSGVATVDAGAGTGITVNVDDIALTVPVTEILGGTNQTAYSTGDILFASGSNALSKLTIGSSGQLLTVSGGVPAWSTEVGDITEVVAGTNLGGGGASGTVTLNLDAALTGLTNIDIAETAGTPALTISGSGTSEVVEVDGTNATGDTAALFRGGLVSKRSTTNGQQGYGLVSRGYVSNELCPTNVDFTVDGSGDVTVIDEFVDSGKTILLRKVVVVYQVDKNPFTVTETGTAIAEMGLSSVVTTFTYASGAGAGQSGDLVSMARVAS